MELLVGIGALVLVALVALARRRSRKRTDRYRPVTHLLTPAERSFHAALKEAIGGACVIAPKVRVADVLEGNHIGALNRIAQKHFDFLLCDASTFAILAAIELDDSSHNSARARKSDDVKNAAAQSANFALIRFRTQSRYSVPAIREKLNEVLRLGDLRVAPRVGDLRLDPRLVDPRLGDLRLDDGASAAPVPQSQSTRSNGN